MKIKDIMTTEVRTCTPGTSLAAAAVLMLDGDCGVLPVVDDKKLVGIVTDRAIRARQDDTWQRDAMRYEDLRVTLRTLLEQPGGAPRRIGPGTDK